MRENLNDEKIQTGLRIPQERYSELKEMADRSGISLNAVILFLVDIGISAVNRGIEESGRFEPRTPQRSGE